MSKTRRNDGQAVKARKNRSLSYHEGADESQNDPSAMRDAEMKTPYGGTAKSLPVNAGKLGEIGEPDQPSWVDTWSKLQVGPNGTGPVRDENYGVQRPRTEKRANDKFKECNPEFQDVANEGDWTSSKWTPNI